MSDFWRNVGATVVGGLLYAEYAWLLPRLSGAILRRAASRLPRELRDDCLKQWTADAASLSPIAGLVNAFDLWLRGRSIILGDLRQLQGDEGICEPIRHQSYTEVVGEALQSTWVHTPSPIARRADDSYWQDGLEQQSFHRIMKKIDDRLLATRTSIDNDTPTSSVDRSTAADFRRFEARQRTLAEIRLVTAARFYRQGRRGGR